MNIEEIMPEAAARVQEWLEIMQDHCSNGGALFGDLN